MTEPVRLHVAAKRYPRGDRTRLRGQAVCASVHTLASAGRADVGAEADDFKANPPRARTRSLSAVSTKPAKDPSKDVADHSTATTLWSACVFTDGAR